MGKLSPCLDCGGEDIDVTPAAVPGRMLAFVRCRQCGTAVLGDSTERALWIWNLPRTREVPASAQSVPEAGPEAGLSPRGPVISGGVTLGPTAESLR